MGSKSLAAYGMRRHNKRHDFSAPFRNPSSVGKWWWRTSASVDGP